MSSALRGTASAFFAPVFRRGFFVPVVKNILAC